jgi:hypothetical protein
VRTAYFDALTRSAQSDREASLTRAFEGLGRQAHLVQDAASPAHTRNDPHLLYNYESLVDQVRRQDQNVFTSWLSGSLDTPGVPDPGWRVLDSNAAGTVSDSAADRRRPLLGGNPPSRLGALIGLAEYTNANFFSEDRIFTENDADPLKRFPYPKRSSVTEQDFDVRVRNATVKRRYFVKSTDGAAGYRLATVGLLRDYHQRFYRDWTRVRESPALDEGVYRDYAERLVPRAVAYSTRSWTISSRGLVIASGTDLSFGFANGGDEAMDRTFTLYYDGTGDVRPVPGPHGQSAGAVRTRGRAQPVAPTSPRRRSQEVHVGVSRRAGQ